MVTSFIQQEGKGWYKRGWMGIVILASCKHHFIRVHKSLVQYPNIIISITCNTLNKIVLLKKHYYFTLLFLCFMYIVGYAKLPSYLPYIQCSTCLSIFYSFIEFLFINMMMHFCPLAAALPAPRSYVFQGIKKVGK